MRVARRGVSRRVVAAVAVTICILGGVAAQAAIPPAPHPYVPEIGASPEGWLLAPPSKVLINLPLPGKVVGTKGAHSNAVWREVLLNANRYALTTWWDKYMRNKEVVTAPEVLLNGEEVRRFTSEAYSLAVSLATGAYDAKATGLDRPTAIQRTALLVGLVARNHKINTTNGTGWGGSWQGSYWASMVAQAAWLLGADLPASDSLLVGRMLEYEATVTTWRPVHYYRDRSGTVLTPGDSGGEELAWDGMGLFTAVELLPFNTKRAYWAEQAYLRMVAAYSRPSDVFRDVTVSGMNLSVWLRGSNAEPSGFIVNHGRLNPDYTACVGLSLAAASLAPLLGDAVPNAARFNAGVTYASLSQYRFPRSGETVYRPGTGAINYPDGSSWGNLRPIAFASLDAQMRALGFGATAHAADWESRHVDDVLKMQQRGTSGQSYQEGDNDRYPLREEMVAANAGLAYLTDWVAAKNLVRWDDSPASAKTVQRLHL